jgi:simple sugar transport system ATP-binding protein
VGNSKRVFSGVRSHLPKVLVLVHPTQGVDIASKDSLFAITDRARATGTAVLVVSDDLDELIICDRVIVLFKGRVHGEYGAGWKDDDLVASIEGFDRNA